MWKRTIRTTIVTTICKIRYRVALCITKAGAGDDDLDGRGRGKKGRASSDNNN